MLYPVIDEQIGKQRNVSKFVYGKNGIDVVPLFHFQKAQRGQARAYEGNVRGDSRGTLVKVFESLKIRNENEDEQRLLERVSNGLQLRE